MRPRHPNAIASDPSTSPVTRGPQAPPPAVLPERAALRTGPRFPAASPPSPRPNHACWRRGSGTNVRTAYQGCGGASGGAEALWAWPPPRRPASARGAWSQSRVCAPRPGGFWSRQAARGAWGRDRAAPGARPVLSRPEGEEAEPRGRRAAAANARPPPVLRSELASGAGGVPRRRRSASGSGEWPRPMGRVSGPRR